MCENSNPSLWTMLCPTCRALYLAWVATCKPMKVLAERPSDMQLKEIDNQRERPDYQAALQAYREHRAEVHGEKAE